MLYAVNNTIATSRKHAIAMAKRTAAASKEPTPIYCIARRRVCEGWMATCEALAAVAYPDGSVRFADYRNWRPIAA